MSRKSCCCFYHPQKKWINKWFRIQHTSLGIVNFKQSKAKLFSVSSIINFLFVAFFFGQKKKEIFFILFYFLFPSIISAIDTELNGKSFSRVFISREGKKSFRSLETVMAGVEFLLDCPVIKLQIPSSHQWRINWKFSREKSMARRNEECF